MDASSFAFYRSTTARTPAQASCGHAIQAGDIIGHNPRVQRTKCAECWRVWQQDKLRSERVRIRPAQLTKGLHNV